MDDYEREYGNEDDTNERIELILDRLYDIVESSQKGILGNVKFDKAEALDLIDDLRGEIPIEVSRARDILDKRARIISEAEAEAKKIREDAENEAQRIVSQHETTKTVNAWAQEKENEVMDYYREMCTGANRYAEDCLGKVAEIIEQRLEAFKRTACETEEEFRRSLGEIYKNKASLTNYEGEDYQENRS